MKIPIEKERGLLYVWISAAFLVLQLLIDLNSAHYPAIFINHIWLVIYLLVNNFILFEYSLPFINLKWKRILIAPFLIFVHLMFYSFGAYGWRSLGVGLGIFTPLATYKSWEDAVESRMAYSVASIFFFGVIKYTYDYRRLKAMAQKLRIEKQEAELNYLKSQTNPHFLFNTLNNIYALARDKSDLAPESILRLSKILRFMLYEAGGAFIAIEQELKIISDYISLEQLRYDDSLKVNFNYDVEDMKQALPPLLLISLVENAFKHGASETRDQPFVDIHLSVNQRKLTFFVTNSREAVAGDGKVKENIGLSNLRRQLELLYNEYELSVQQSGTIFNATLKINLASHV